MTSPAPHHENPTPNVGTRRELTLAHKVILTMFVIVIVALSASALVGFLYKDKVLPGVSVAGVSLSGLSQTAAAAKLEDRYQHMIDGGLALELNDQTATIPLSPQSATDPDLIYPLIDAKIDEAATAAFAAGRTNNLFSRFLGPLTHLLGVRSRIELPLSLADARFEQAVRDAFPNAESPGTPTDFTAVQRGSEWNITVTPSSPGSIIDVQQAKAIVVADASDLTLSPLSLHLREQVADITVDEARTMIPAVTKTLDTAPYTLTHMTKNGPAQSYTISPSDLANWIVPKKKDGNLYLSVEIAKLTTLLNDIRADIDVSPRDAEFIVEGKRVVSFVPSRTGERVNEDKLIADLENAFADKVSTIALSVETAEPKISTAQSNTFGIAESLGTGISRYGGSPSNRRANIAHGATKLNGLLIAPGETLSLLEHLRPFTVADGYLPELVIKGDEIKPEIGGGLCQIGTTTFRAAMNSGLDIAERRNHSLVVSYYNDLANNQPGTDATLYDPAPDLKIKNDTAHHVLLQTVNDTANSELRFTFWGTSDGREGSYTPPKVLSRTAPGTTIIKETPNLPAGTKNCQNAYTGATASFDYNIKKADGSIISRTFTSVYRALPAICLVGTGGTNPATTTPVTVE